MDADFFRTVRWIQAPNFEDFSRTLVALGEGLLLPS
jgi:hypothetical protein